MMQVSAHKTIGCNPTSAPLAKLSRPRLFRVLNRERLFTALDAARDRPALWISGPPGAGKTSLAASYTG
jgi:LuxR family maltose regulon positive regulatory protein